MNYERSLYHLQRRCLVPFMRLFVLNSVFQRRAAAARSPTDAGVLLICAATGVAWMIRIIRRPAC
jgi:hypothetical protein